MRRAFPELSKRLFSRSSSSPSSIQTLTLASPHRCSEASSTFRSPWQALQSRGVKVCGSELRAGNIIERKDRLYEVVKVDHSHEGRGKATIKVELRDVDGGNKVSQRFNTEEAVEKIYVDTKFYIYMCTDHDGKVLLMDPDTLDQLEVSEDLFGISAKFLQDDMRVKLESYNGIPLSASVPKQVTCVVKETTTPLKGSSANPRDKNAVLENGVTVKVPPHILVGDSVIIETVDNTYLRRAK